MHGGSKQSARAAEATQELLAADVLEVVDAQAAPLPPSRAETTQELLAADVVEVMQQPPRGPDYSASSIAPVGIDLPPMRAPRMSEDEQEEYNPTRELRAIPRRRLAPVVVGAVGVCAVILLAAGVVQMSRSGDTPVANAAQRTTVTIASKPTATSMSTSISTSTTNSIPAPKPTPMAVAPAPATTSATVGGDAPTTGTILLGHAGRVWLDGKRLTGTAALVRCGSHRIKLGAYAKSRPIDVPCGGEVTVKR
jgi:hypothetical protein